MRIFTDNFIVDVIKNMWRGIIWLFMLSEILYAHICKVCIYVIKYVKTLQF